MAPWLDAAWAQIEQALIGGTRVQSWCLVHPPGLPIRPLSDRFVTRLLCLAPQGADACGKCASCNMNRDTSHPDITMLVPEGAAGMIKVGPIRDAVKLAYMTASLGGARVFRVIGAEAMNADSSNALLKVIEEPPQGSFFVLETSSPGRLLPTLVSRLRMIAVKPPEPEELASYAQSISADPARFARAELLLGEPLAPEQGADRFALAEQVLEAMQAVRHGQDPELAAKAFAKQDAEAILTTVSRVIEACIRGSHDAFATEVLRLEGARPPEAMLFQLHDRVQEVRRQAVQRIHVNIPMALGMLLSGWAFIWSKVLR